MWLSQTKLMLLIPTFFIFLWLLLDDLVLYCLLTEFVLIQPKHYFISSILVSRFLWLLVYDINYFIFKNIRRIITKSCKNFVRKTPAVFSHGVRIGMEKFSSPDDVKYRPTFFAQKTRWTVRSAKKYFALSKEVKKEVGPGGEKKKEVTSFFRVSHFFAWNKKLLPFLALYKKRYIHHIVYRQRVIILVIVDKLRRLLTYKRYNYSSGTTNN